MFCGHTAIFNILKISKVYDLGDFCTYPHVKIKLNAYQCSHRPEKYLNLEGFLEKSLKFKSALKSTGKSLKSLEKSLNSTIFCRTHQC